MIPFLLKKLSIFFMFSYQHSYSITIKKGLTFSMAPLFKLNFSHLTNPKTINNLISCIKKK